MIYVAQEVLYNDFVKFWALQQGKGIFSNIILTFGSTLKMKGEVAQLESDKNSAFLSALLQQRC